MNDAMSPEEAIGAVIFSIVMYFLPAFIAMIRKHNNTTAIVLLDLFLGWTVIVWFVCLVWAIIGAKQQSMIVNFNNNQVAPTPTYMPTMPVQQPPIQQPIATQSMMQQPQVQPPMVATQVPMQSIASTEIAQQYLAPLTLQFVVGEGIFMPPNIPFDKLNNAISSYAMNVNPQHVIALIDETAFGSAKEGMLITFDAIYAKEMLEDIKIVRIQDIQTITCDAGIMSVKVFVNGGQLISLTQPNKQGIANICGQINAFIAQNRQLPAPAITNT